MLLIAAAGSILDSAAMAQQAKQRKAQTFAQCVARGMAGTGTAQSSGAPKETAEAWCRANNNGNR
jgi:hypothetical protein